MQLLQEIKETETKLKATQKDKEATLDNYLFLQNKIRKRQQLIYTLQTEIRYADSSMVRSKEVITALEEDIIRLKEEYATTLRTAYHLKINKGILVFLFSANDLNDAFSRWQYVRQYNKYRSRQASVILDTQFMLEDKVEQLEEDRKSKEALLLKEEEQTTLLSGELTSKNQMLSSLKASESKLVKTLEAQQKAHRRLNVAIEAIIKEEVAKMKAAARKPEAKKEEIVVATKISKTFAQSQGQLSWPVASGKVVKYFGTQPHPTLKKIKIVNNGIDIQTNNAAKVYAIYKGKVAGTQYIPGYQNMVIIQHGNYYTVYSNLEEIYVKRGDTINNQEVIGRLGGSKNVVHFEIWKEKERLDPLKWVANK